MTCWTRRLWGNIWVLLVLVSCLTSVSGGGKDDDDDDDEDEASDAFWAGMGRIIIFGGVSLVVAGLFSLTAWIVCSCHEKCRKRQVGSIPPAGLGKLGNSLPPEWSRNLTLQPELTVGFGMMSDGFYLMSNVQLLRQRPGTEVGDGAKWGAPLTTGKHLFEIIWPWGCRGYRSSVGVATKDAPVKGRGATNMVGGSKQSWGVDIVQRRVQHNNQSLGKCPTDGSYVPDRFFMYVDVDEGCLSFGNEVTYWGSVITNLPRGKELYPMIGTNKWEANIQMFYRGSAGTSEFAGYNPNPRPGPSNALPPLSGEAMPPTYADVFNVPPGGKTDVPPRSAWDQPPPTAPGWSDTPTDAPPPYTSPPPPKDLYTQ